MNRSIGRINISAMFFIIFAGCKKGNGNATFRQYGINNSPVIRLSFTAPVNRTGIATGITLTQSPGKLLWTLLTSCPEVKAGMKKLGCTAPYL